MLISCGTLGLDWERTSFSMYLEACEAHNISLDPNASKVEPADPDFRDFMKRRFAKA